MKIFVAAFLFMAIVSSVRGGGEGCCSPDQWQGTLGTAIGFGGPNPDFVAYNAYIFYDASNSRIATNVTVYKNGQVMPYYIVLRKQCTLSGALKGHDCGQGTEKMYIVDLKTNKCYIQDGRFQKACVPDNARFEGSPTFGAGSDTLKTKTFSVDKTVDPGTSVSAWVTVTAKQCIPVGVSAHGATKGVGFMEVAGYSDFKLSIDDPSVFDVPAQCRKDPITTGIPEGIGHMGSIFNH